MYLKSDDLEIVFMLNMKTPSHALIVFVSQMYMIMVKFKVWGEKEIKKS